MQSHWHYYECGEDIVAIDNRYVYALALLADFPYLNYKLASGNIYPIASLDEYMNVKAHEFMIQNINHQTINFNYKCASSIGIPTDRMIDTKIIFKFKTVR